MTDASGHARAGFVLFQSAFWYRTDFAATLQVDDEDLFASD